MLQSYWKLLKEENFLREWKVNPPSPSLPSPQKLQDSKTKDEKQRDFVSFKIQDCYILFIDCQVINDF